MRHSSETSIATLAGDASFVRRHSMTSPRLLGPTFGLVLLKVSATLQAGKTSVKISPVRAEKKSFLTNNGAYRFKIIPLRVC